MSDTELLPAPAGTGRTLRPDRCVVEPSLRFLRFPLARARFTATAGYLDVSEDPALFVELDVPSVRTYPWPLKYLIRHDARVLTFTSGEFVVEGRRVRIDGWIGDRPLVLSGELRPVDEEGIVLWAKGILPRPRRAPWYVRRVHVEIAIEFVR
ncbi:Hypothetical protein AJAP_03590 [Amycolatopsis japonica]|uniref:YceI family protein n=1 Tax=Amycolatopsis japonica TaxID=208439 RepID=A0A075ULB0_9PSEU|nr:hypothetical protein [Amycolatopsis japonica]AIG73643.1 Hypothetical protein AJAP_03590 [Amycolatopsis japonica]